MRVCSRQDKSRLTCRRKKGYHVQQGQESLSLVRQISELKGELHSSLFFRSSRILPQQICSGVWHRARSFVVIFNFNRFPLQALILNQLRARSQCPSAERWERARILGKGNEDPRTQNDICTGAVTSQSSDDDSFMIKWKSMQSNFRLIGAFFPGAGELIQIHGSRFQYLTMI